MENDLVKRLMWSGLLAGVGALTTIIANRIATEIWTRVFDEDPPDFWWRPPPQSRSLASQEEAHDAFAERPSSSWARRSPVAWSLAGLLRWLGQGRMTPPAATAPTAARRDRLGGLREGLAPRSRGDRAGEGRGHAEGQDDGARRRRRCGGGRVPRLRRGRCCSTRSRGSSSTCSTRLVGPASAITTVILILLAIVAGLLAKKWLCRPPTPDMAIEEAKIASPSTGVRSRQLGGRA